MVHVTNAQDAYQGEPVLIAVIDRESGRQIVNMNPRLLSDPLIEIRCAGQGFGWHDAERFEWQQRPDGRWHRIVS